MAAKSLESRLAELEKQNRVFRASAGVVAVLLIGCLLKASPLVSQEKPGKIEATAFILRDDEGRIRAALSNLNGGGAALTFFDTSQHVRLLAGMQGNGQPSVQLNDAKEVGRGVFGLDEVGAPGIDLTDRAGRLRVRLNVADREGEQPAALSFRDAKGRTRVSIISWQTMHAFSLLGPDESARSSMAAMEDGTAVSIITAKDGKTIWSAP